MGRRPPEDRPAGPLLAEGVTDLFSEGDARDRALQRGKARNLRVAVKGGDGVVLHLRRRALTLGAWGQRRPAKPAPDQLAFRTLVCKLELGAEMTLRPNPL